MGRKYFSVASGGGTGRTLHPDNMAAGPASYGIRTRWAGCTRTPSSRARHRSGARGNDGLPRHGQQPHGRCDRLGGGGYRAGRVGERQVFQTVSSRHSVQSPRAVSGEFFQELLAAGETDGVDACQAGPFTVAFVVVDEEHAVRGGAEI
jgi:hypothetical protein